MRAKLIGAIFLALNVFFTTAWAAAGSQQNHSTAVQAFKAESERAMKNRMRNADMFIKDASAQERQAYLDTVLKKQPWTLDNSMSPGVNMYFNDIHYGGSKDEYLSVSVGQMQGKHQPNLLTFVVASSVDRGHGLYMTFCNTQVQSQRKKSKCSSRHSYVMTFSECNATICRVQLNNAMLPSPYGSQVNVFQLMMKYDLIGFALYAKGEHIHFAVNTSDLQRKYRY
ncbi:hypothetical protein [Pseudoalteromonas rubra]|uniref:hypothetical protein n=1 Tax=Pseudoalteromonas rubra TaxID=43658 RepID=UPI000F7A1F0D|nr:hypothetical protein [Pseudoalteromonas rubra]